MTCHKPLLDELQRRGIRLTAQRALILEDLCHHAGHRSAEEVYQGVADRLPGLNRATVYRTLEMLHAAGVIATCASPGGVTGFELVRSAGEQHHHLQCRRCGAEYALDRAPVDQLKAEIAARFGFQADLDHLVVTGLCAACAQAEHGQP